MAKSVVAIVGRPNVGKSTLFNRLISRRVAIVDNVAGVTRDRLYRECEWLGRKFLLIDTGGLQPGEEDKIKEETAFQVYLAIEEADVILFMVNAREGLTPIDMEISYKLRHSGKKVILVINKVDDPSLESSGYEFYHLGFEAVLFVSAEHGLNTGDLLEQTVNLLPSEKDEGMENSLSVAIVGRPNVGKSSLLNALLGEKRVIVDDQPGTTRDAIDTIVKRGDKLFNFIDTAGIRRKSRVYEDLEYYSVLRAFKAVTRSEVCILVIDGEKGLSDQDKKIAGRIIKEGKACLVVVNKWDLVFEKEKEIASNRDDIENFKAFFKKKKEELKSSYTKRVRNDLYFVDYSPILFTSALNKWGVERIFDTVTTLAEENEKRIDTSTLNQVIHEAIADRPPPSYKGQTMKVYFAIQPKVQPPTILLFVNSVKLMHFSYRRYIENRLRDAFGFEGAPIKIILKEKK